MTIRVTDTTAVDGPALAAARLLLSRMGIDRADLITAATPRSPVPTFAAYVPVVAGAVTAGTRRAYSCYWARLVAALGQRRLDEPTPSQLQQLAEPVKTGAAVRRTSRGGRNAAENFIAATRCLYRYAERDGLIAKPDNPARKVAKPRRLPSTRRALTDVQLAEINHIAATTGDDPQLDTMRLRLHTETAARRGGALNLRPRGLDPDQCLILLREWRRPGRRHSRSHGARQSQQHRSAGARSSADHWQRSMLRWRSGPLRRPATHALAAPADRKRQRRLRRRR